jgi:hypothetical protein
MGRRVAFRRCSSHSARDRPPLRRHKDSVEHSPRSFRLRSQSSWHSVRSCSRASRVMFGRPQLKNVTHPSRWTFRFRLLRHGFAAAVVAALLPGSAVAAIWVTLDKHRAPVGAKVRARADSGGENLAIFLAPETVVQASQPPRLVRVAGGIRVRSVGRPPFKVGMLPSTMLEAVRKGTAGLVFVGELSDEQGTEATLTFEVPARPPGLYRILVHCRSCAGDGGSLFWGETLAIEPGSASSSHWPIVAAAIATALVLASATGMWVRRTIVSRSRNSRGTVA